MYLEFKNMSHNCITFLEEMTRTEPNSLLKLRYIHFAYVAI